MQKCIVSVHTDTTRSKQTQNCRKTFKIRRKKHSVFLHRHCVCRLTFPVSIFYSYIHPEPFHLLIKQRALLLPYYYQFVDGYLWGTCSWNSFGMLYAFAGFNGYLLLGHYLKNLDWSMKKTLATGIPMFVIGYVVTFFGFRHMTALPDYTDEMLELFFTYCSLNVVMMTIPVFMLAKKVNIRSERIRKALANLTVCGFGVYMIHYFFTGPAVMLTRAIGIPIPLQIPVAAVMAFAVSWLIVNLVHRIGKPAKYIMG